MKEGLRASPGDTEPKLYNLELASTRILLQKISTGCTRSYYLAHSKVPRAIPLSCIPYVPFKHWPRPPTSMM